MQNPAKIPPARALIICGNGGRSKNIEAFPADGILLAPFRPMLTYAIIPPTLKRNINGRKQK
jgi:hypothetical protein